MEKILKKWFPNREAQLKKAERIAKMRLSELKKLGHIKQRVCIQSILDKSTTRGFKIQLSDDSFTHIYLQLACRHIRVSEISEIKKSRAIITVRTRFTASTLIQLIDEVVQIRNEQIKKKSAAA